MPDSVFEKTSKIKFDSQAKVKIDQSVICDKAFADEQKNGTMTQVVERSVKEALEWYSKESAVEESSRSDFY